MWETGMLVPFGMARGGRPSQNSNLNSTATNFWPNRKFDHAKHLHPSKWLYYEIFFTLVTRKVHLEPLGGFLAKSDERRPPKSSFSALCLKNSYLLTWSNVKFKISIPSYFCWVNFFWFLLFINANPEAFLYP